MHFATVYISVYRVHYAVHGYIYVAVPVIMSQRGGESLMATIYTLHVLIVNITHILYKYNIERKDIYSVKNLSYQNILFTQ